MGYVLLALAYLWPLVRRFGSALAGDGFDMYVFRWDNWWLTRALSGGQNPYHTRMIFYPSGAHLYFHSFSWLNTGIWWLLRGLIGDVAAYNFTVWWSWPLAGFGAYLLAREVMDERRAAFVAGLIYTFYPYHFAQRNHLNLLSVQWTPFALLFLMRAARHGRARDGLLAGLFFACAGLSGWHLLTLSGMLGGLWLLHAWLTKRHRWAKENWRALLLMAVVFGLLTGPFLAPLAWEQFVNPAGQDPYLGKEGETQTDLIAYVLPNLYHPLWGRLAAPIHQRFLRNKDHAVALGYLPLALVGYGLLRWTRRKVWPQRVGGKGRTPRFSEAACPEPFVPPRAGLRAGLTAGLRAGRSRREAGRPADLSHIPRRAHFWLGSLLVFWLLALGPFPRVNGVPYPQIPLPYRLVGWSLPVRSLRNPERFNILVGLCLALVVGVVVRDLLRRLPGRRAAFVAVTLGALVLLEYWAWPFPTTRPDVPDFYHQLAAEPGDFAIVDLPITNDLSKLYMYYQTVHGRPTVTGHVSRPPAGAYDFIERNPFLYVMWQDQRPDPAGDPSADLAALAEVGVRYIIIHVDRLKGEQLEAVLAYLDRAPTYARYYADERLIVYRFDGTQMNADRR